MNALIKGRSNRNSPHTTFDWIDVNNNNNNTNTKAHKNQNQRECAIFLWYYFQFFVLVHNYDFCYCKLSTRFSTDLLHTQTQSTFKLISTIFVLFAIFVYSASIHFRVVAFVFYSACMLSVSNYDLSLPKIIRSATTEIPHVLCV